MALQIVLDCAEKENGRIAGKIAMTTKFMLTPVHRNRKMALQIVLDNSSGCTEMLAMTRAWGERYTLAMPQAFYTKVVRRHAYEHFYKFELNDEVTLLPGHDWESPPDNYDEWLQRYEKEEQLRSYKDLRNLVEKMDEDFEHGVPYDPYDEHEPMPPSPRYPVL